MTKEWKMMKVREKEGRCNSSSLCFSNEVFAQLSIRPQKEQGSGKCNCKKETIGKTGCHNSGSGVSRRTFRLKEGRPTSNVV